MRFWFPSILGILLLPLCCTAEYERTSFVDLTGTSQLIAAGTITKVEKDTFELTIEDLIFGPELAGKSITVRKFQDWPCAQRWDHYQVGQKELVFLNSIESDATWRIRGAGCEGESPIINNVVLAAFIVPGAELEIESNRGKQRRPAVRYDQLKAAIVDFRATYRITPATKSRRKDGEYSAYVPFEQIRLILPPPGGEFRPRTPPIVEFSKRSTIHRYLAESLDEERAKMEKYKEAR